MKHQEVVGVVHTRAWSFPVLVLAEVWPSFSYAAQALGCLDITTWCHFESAKAKVEFTSTSLGKTLSEGSLAFLAMRFASQSSVTVLIQGSASFTNECRKWEEEQLKMAKTLEVIPEMDVDIHDNTFLWKGHLSHRELGGVTSGVWRYRCSEPLDDPQIGVKRNLGLVLNPTHGEGAMPKVPAELLLERAPLTGDNLVALV